MRRKLFCCAILMVLGDLFITIDSIVGVVLTLSLMGIIYKYNDLFKVNRKWVFYLCVFFLSGVALTLGAEHRVATNALNPYEGARNQYIGEVIEIEQTDKESYKMTCNISGSRVLVTYYHQLKDYPQILGCKIQFSTTLEKPRPAANPRTFDYAQYLKTKKICHIGTIESFQIFSRNKSPVLRFKSYILDKREAFFLEGKSEGATTAFLKGVLAGDTHQLDETVMEEFRINGTAHVLAVSGLHVGMLYSLYQLVAKKRSSKILKILFILTLLIYGTVALWSTSVTRAIFLIVLVFWGQLNHRRYDMITALAVVVVVMLLDNPFILTNTGFQMSFLAVLSIGFIGPIISKKINKSLAVVLSVQLGLMPYIAYTFNYVPLISILCNIPIVFLVSIVVPLGLLSFAMFFFTGIQIPLLYNLLTSLAELIIKANHIFAADGLFSKDIVSPPLWVICLIYGLIFLITSEFFLVYCKRKEYKKFVPLVIILFSVVCGINQWERTPFDDADLVFLDVGQGDCIQIKGEKNILIDGGGNIRYDIGKKTLKPYLLKNGISHLDLAAATHLHADHYLGLEQLGECFKIEQLLIKGKAGQRIVVSKDTWIDILWPTEIDPDTEDENLNSLIFKIHQKGVTTLITGDITEVGERALLQKYKGTNTLEADVLKVAHHGSKYSSCEDFLAVVNPEIAVISVGKNNYGHPNNDVIDKLRKKGIMVYRTDISGAVGIISRKGKLLVCTKNQ